MQPVGQARRDDGPGGAVGLAQLLEGFLKQRLRLLVGAHGRREDAAVAERRALEQVAALEVPGGVRRLGEPLVPGGVLPSPVVSARQIKEQLAAQRLVPWPEAVKQLERLLKVADRDFDSYLAQCALGGQALVPDRLLRAADARGRAEVVR